MQVTVTSVFLWALFLAARIHARPQEIGITKVIHSDITKGEDTRSDARNNSTIRTITSMKPKDVGSRVEPPNAERDLKGYQYMDNSLRTIATQLMNVSSVKDESNIKDNTMLDKVETRLGLHIRKYNNPMREIISNHNYTNDKMKSGTLVFDVEDGDFDRSTSSKYNYFKTSHPGEAMALTEEELERELATSKLITSQKKKATTTGGISTWILLNPPSTTVKTLIADASKEINNKKENEKKTTLNFLKPTVSTLNITAAMQKNSHTRVAPSKVSNSPKPTSATLKFEKLTTYTNPYTISRLETTENNFDSVSEITTPHSRDENLTTMKTTTKRIVSPSRTPRPIVTTPKTTTVVTQATTIKFIKSNHSNQSTQSNAIRKVTNKSEITNNSGNVTSRIEKVTFRPVHMITTPKNNIQQAMPMFVTKLQASLHTDSKSNVPSVTAVSMDSIPIKQNKSDVNITFTNRVQATIKPKPSKPNNVLNVQLKRPVDTHTKIEIQPIKVNTPVLTIEKVKESKKDNEIDAVKPITMGDSKIDVKFIFNPELTKIVETPVENTAATTSVSTSTTTTTTTTTTKRPKQKRKKNKIRRRKPSVSTTPNSIVTSTAITLNTDLNNIDENQHVTDSEINETSVQESKVVPDSDSSSTKNKKKQVQKPITSQIYSFLSREVMPSFGVMSLVGLGLGLASYFFYPFGGTIARRNYEVEPNYKYNLNEYGGNYGQSEEEVFSKVLQGMTTSNVKYGGMKDYENNYYRYQAYDGAYTDPSYITRRGDIRHPTSSMPVYRPNNTPMSYNSKYRKNEFHYPDLSTTPNYYERHIKPEFMKNQGSADRQFVVGNVPKDYIHDEKLPAESSSTTEIIQTEFEKQIAQNLKFVNNPTNIPSNFEQPEAQALKVNEGYEEIEIAPTAVAVEHGPRSLKLAKPESSAQDKLSNNTSIVKMRRKRESVIQQIPTRDEIDRLDDEANLSNEIFGIIDSAIPPVVSEAEVKPSFNELESLSSVANDVKNNESLINTDQSTTIITESSTTIVQSTTPNLISSITDKSISTIADNLETSTEINSPSSNPPIIFEIGDTESTTISVSTTTSSKTTTESSPPERFNFLNFIKKIAEIKFRVGVTVLKHASENLAKYLGDVQKKLNGET